MLKSVRTCCEKWMSVPNLVEHVGNMIGNVPAVTLSSNISNTREQGRSQKKLMTEAMSMEDL